MTAEDAKLLFPTQSEPMVSAFLAVDLAIGAPFAPLPKSFYRVPDQLAPCQPLASPTEISEIVALRRRFNIGNYQPPYVADVARAFRLARGKSSYLEIGTFDRGNLAYMASILSDNALLVGVDVVEEQSRDGLLRQQLKPAQSYSPIAGSSRDPSTVAKVANQLDGRKLDVIFIDGDHTAFGVLSDYAQYEQFLADDGAIFFHDAVWEGNPEYKGSAHALSEIDKLDPVFLIDGENPVRRFLRSMWTAPMWGVVGVVFAQDQFWRKP